jgi:hypothetical protein
MRSSTLSAHRLVVTERSPVLGETFYDRTTSALWTLFLVAGCVCALLIAIWLQFVDSGVPRSFIKTVPIVVSPREIVQPELPQRLNVIQVPEDAASFGARQNSESDLPQLFETVTSASVIESATRTNHKGKANDSETTGLEAGGSFLHRLPPRRWSFEISAPRSASEYGRMLDHFGVELGAVFSDNRVVYLSHVSGVSQIRRADNLEAETRIFTVWSAGELVDLDHEFFRSSGVNITGAKLVQFFPPETEEMLQEKAESFAGRTSAEIYHTWFQLVPTADGFTFDVVRQTGR